MKKLMRRLLSVVAALTIVLAMAVPAMAATISINNAVDGETYSAYKLLNYTASTDGKAYSYYLTKAQYDNGDYGAALVTAGFQFDQSADGTQYILKNAIDLKADDIINGITEKESNGNVKVKDTIANGALDKSTVTASESSATFDDLDEGYYVLTSTTGSLVTLKRRDEDAIVYDKNEKPTVEKTAKTEGGATDGSSANVGDTIDYSVVLHAKKGATNYVFHDDLSAGLTLVPDSLTVYLVNDSNNPVPAGPNTYIVDTFNLNDAASTTNGEKETTDVKITFADSYIANLMTGDTKAVDITISYKAKVNDSAKSIDKVTNKATIDFGHNDSSSFDQIETKLFGFGLKKVDGSDKNEDGSYKTFLDGVQFTLTKIADSKTYYYNSSATGTESVWTTTAPKAGSNGKYTGAVLETENGGKLAINGVAAGNYVLTEVYALPGYNLLAKPVNVTIDNNGKLTATGAVTASNVDAKNSTTGTIDAFSVENNKGGILPSTGGMGTTIFYALGAALAIGAGVILVTRKRLSK